MYAAELKQQKATGNKITAGILKQKNPLLHWRERQKIKRHGLCCAVFVWKKWNLTGINKFNYYTANYIKIPFMEIILTK